jgi:hypothetical protein
MGGGRRIVVVEDDRMRAKILPIILGPTAYRRLEQEARAQERDPLQQARWLLKQALGEPKNECSAAALTTISRGLEATAR